MTGITFSEQEVKKLILALASTKTPEMDEAKETPEHEAKPQDAAEDKAEGEAPDKESAGKPFAKPAENSEQESTKAMLERKLKEDKGA